MLMLFRMWLRQFGGLLIMFPVMLLMYIVGTDALQPTRDGYFRVAVMSTGTVGALIVIMLANVPEEAMLAMPISRRKLHLSRLLCTWLAIAVVLGSAAVTVTLGSSLGASRVFLGSMAMLLCCFMAISSAGIALSYKFVHMGHYKGMIIAIAVVFAPAFFTLFVGSDNWYPNEWIACGALLLCGLFTVLGLSSIDKYEVLPHGSGTQDSQSRKSTMAADKLGKLDKFSPVIRIAFRQTWLTRSYLIFILTAPFFTLAPLGVLVMSKGPLKLGELAALPWTPGMVALCTWSFWTHALKLIATGMSRRTAFRVIAVPYVTIVAIGLIVMVSTSFISSRTHVSNTRFQMFPGVYGAFAQPAADSPPRMLRSSSDTLFDSAPRSVAILGLFTFGVVLLAMWLSIPTPGRCRAIVLRVCVILVIGYMGVFAILMFMPVRFFELLEGRGLSRDWVRLSLEPIAVFCRDFFWLLLAAGLVLCVVAWRSAAKAFDHAELDRSFELARKRRNATPFDRTVSSLTD